MFSPEELKWLDQLENVIETNDLTKIAKALENDLPSFQVKVLLGLAKLNNWTIISRFDFSADRLSLHIADGTGKRLRVWAMRMPLIKGPIADHRRNIKFWSKELPIVDETVVDLIPPERLSIEIHKPQR